MVTCKNRLYDDSSKVKKEPRIYVVQCTIWWWWDGMMLLMHMSAYENWKKEEKIMN